MLPDNEHRRGRHPAQGGFAVSQKSAGRMKPGNPQKERGKIPGVIITITVLLTISFNAKAGDLLVPQDYASIQEAVDSASPGDRILVSPGVYRENIQIVDKDLLLTGQYVTKNNPSLIRETKIDGSQSLASAIRVHGGEVHIEGFKITGGRGTVWYDSTAGYGYRQGGGLLATFCTIFLSHNIITQNEATDTTDVMSAGGGGICLENSQFFISNNIVQNNRGRFGGGLAINYSSGTVNNNLIVHNDGGEDFGGGGLWLYRSSDVIIENNTICFNLSVDESIHTEYGAGQGGAMVFWGGDATVQNNIIWGNNQTASNMPIHEQEETPVTYTYNNIQNYYAYSEAKGSLCAPPLFSDSTYLLSIFSPCIDQGSPAEKFQDPGGGDRAAFPSMGTCRNDMGVYGGPDRMQLFDFAVSVADRQNIPHSGETPKLISNYPNPFNSETSISFFLLKEQFVELELFDIQGRSVCSIHEGHFSPGNHTTKLTVSTLESGTYFIRLKTDFSETTHKCILLK